ncbi:MAG: hypothetical protein QOF83_4023 [Solirubrobacteraceae bacterium]|nr:hypothetical protein [Solirubrobacteraceae bacterium]
MARGSEAGDKAAQAGRLDEAEKLYARADADGGPAASGKLGLREHRGDVDGALDALQRADEGGDGFGTLRLGLLLAGLNRWEEAKLTADARPAGPAERPGL